MNMSSVAEVPWYYSHKVPDYFILAHRLISLFFHYLDTRDWMVLAQYRIHSSTDTASHNRRVSPTAVFYTVIFMQVLQTVLGHILLGQAHTFVPDHMAKVASLAQQLALFIWAGEHREPMLSRLAYSLYWWGIPLFQLLLGMFFRNFHSWHHRLDAPYAFSALYNHPVESILLDLIGPVLAESLSGMSTRQAALLFSIATLKTVDDHCGYRLPFDPLQIVSRNNADYHDIHHQQIGIKHNFAQPFFVHWDTLLGTQMTRQEMERRKSNKAKLK
ncbi:hypothetical protein B0H19DRAFT_1216722 [Mycena capillaripes]|nr:hypothetical protein B0H19DRAFT_1216722 [Mycena capillaripes]